MYTGTCRTFTKTNLETNSQYSTPSQPVFIRNICKVVSFQVGKGEPGGSKTLGQCRLHTLSGTLEGPHTCIYTNSHPTEALLFELLTRRSKAHTVCQATSMKQSRTCVRNRLTILRSAGRLNCNSSLATAQMACMHSHSQAPY